jgi:predicted AlkP superfamily phosphohydrolase/phosphomutase
MAVNPKHTIGFLAGGYRNVAQIKGVPVPDLLNSERGEKASSLLVGWDAADWEVIKPLMREGKMPVFTEFNHGSVQANLATLDPPISPMLWSSVATSTWPSAHGIHGFTEINDGTVRAVRGSSLTQPTFWEYLEDNGVPVSTIGWWPSHPAECSKHGGLRISNLAASEDLKWIVDGVSPESHQKILASLILQPKDLNPSIIASFFPNQDIDSSDDVVRSVLKITLHAINVHTMATYALDHCKGGHVSVYYDALDHFKHLGMKYMPPRLKGINTQDFDRYKFIIESAYRLHDLFLGKLLEGLDEDGHAIVMSDHGFKNGLDRLAVLPHHAGAPALEHRHYGIFAARGPRVKTEVPPSGMNLLDIAPVVLAMYGLVKPISMKGLVPPGLMEEPDCLIETLTAASPNHHESVEGDAVLLESLVALGYLEEKHLVNKEGRLLENIYYLARSLRAEGRSERAWQVLSGLNIDEKSPMRYQQLAASLLAESGQYEALDKLLSGIQEFPEVFIWEYYKSLIQIYRGSTLSIPRGLFETEESHELVLWGKLLSKANRLNDLSKLLAGKTLHIPDTLNLRLKLELAQNRWEDALETALESTTLRYHQPNIHGALAVIFKKLNMPSESYSARVLQLKMMGMQDREAPLFIVSGPPRSGTSMAMQLLAAAGVGLVTDHIRQKDKFNARGYFEHNKVKDWDLDENWLSLQRGKALKIVEPLLLSAPLPRGLKVIVCMRRSLGSLLQSQRSMSGRESAPLGWDEQQLWLDYQEKTEVQMSMDPHAILIELNFEDIIHAVETNELSPSLQAAFKALSKHTPKTVDISVLKAVVEPQLRRF